MDDSDFSSVDSVFSWDPFGAILASSRKRKYEENDDETLSLCSIDSCFFPSSELIENEKDFKVAKEETKYTVKGEKQVKQMKMTSCIPHSLLLPPPSVADSSVPSFGRASLGSSFLVGAIMAGAGITKRKVCASQRVNELVCREVENFLETWIRNKERTTDFVLLSGESADSTRQRPFTWPRKRRMKKAMQDQVECMNLFEIVYKRCISELADGKEDDPELLSDIVTAFRKEIKRLFKKNSTAKNPNIESFSIGHGQVVQVCRKGDMRFSPIYILSGKRYSVPNYLEIVHPPN